MDYKELIKRLRLFRDDWFDEYGQSTSAVALYFDMAADAIEKLLSERDAAEKDQEIYLAALNKWGALMQTVVAIEELSELQKELCKALRGMQHNNHIAEEIADVAIMLEQMTMLYHVRDAVESWRKEKLERLEKRIKG